jgi:hypothetical protein
VAGTTYSFGAWSNDFWVLKLDESGTIPNCPLEEDSTATITYTTVTGSDTLAIVAGTTITPGDTAVISSNTDCNIDTQCYYSPAPPSPAAIGGEAYPVNKLAVLAPWIGLAVLLAGTIGWLMLRRRRVHN